MKTHRCRRGEEEKEEGVSIFEKTKAIYRGGRVKNMCGSHNYSKKKTCKNMFFDLTIVQKRLKNVLFVVQTTGQKLLVQSGKYNPDYT